MGEVIEQRFGLRDGVELAVKFRMVSDVSDFFKSVLQNMGEGLDEIGQSYPYGRDELRNLMIQILEEKLGLKVEVCRNCRYLSMVGFLLTCGRVVVPPKEVLYYATCEHWTKEVSEKK